MRTADCTCDFCGDRGAALWGSTRPTGVCKTCAVEVLPMMIADAIELPKGKSREAATLALKKVAEVFRQGIRARKLRGEN